MNDEGDWLHLDEVSYFYIPVRPKWNHRYKGLVGEKAFVSVLIGVELCDEDFIWVLDHCEDWISPLLFKGPYEGPQNFLSIHFAVVKGLAGKESNKLEICRTWLIITGQGNEV